MRKREASLLLQVRFLEKVGCNGKSVGLALLTILMSGLPCMNESISLANYVAAEQAGSWAYAMKTVKAFFANPIGGVL